MSRRTHFVVVSVALALLLTGCSGSSDEQSSGKVATLRSAAAPSSAPAGPQRPVYRMDATDDEVKALAKPWMACLRKEGVAKPEEALGLVQKGGGAEDLGRLFDREEDVPAWKACEPKQPESFEQHQLRTSPTEFKDNQREWYRCAQSAGYKLTAPDPETGQFGITEVGPNGDAGSAKMQDCRRQAFDN